MKAFIDAEYETALSLARADTGTEMTEDERASVDLERLLSQES